MTDKPYGELLDEMDHEAKYLPATTSLPDLLRETLVTLRHSRVFICTRERMHPEGRRQYDELLAKLEAATLTPAICQASDNKGGGA